MECVVLSLSVEILAGLDGAKLICFRGRLSLWISSELRRAIYQEVCCVHPGRGFEQDALSFGVLKVCHKEFGVWLD